MRFLLSGSSAGTRPNPGFPHPKHPEGFVPAGSVVVLPDDYLPSRFWTPLDAIAQQAVARARALYAEHNECSRRQRLLPPLSEPERAELLAVPPVGEAPPTAPVFDLRPDAPKNGPRAADR